MRIGPGAVIVLAAAVVLALLPLTMSDYHQLQWAFVGMYACAILGLNLLTGYTGQISLGHGAFMAIGGYTTAILSADPLLTLPLAGIVAGLAGLVFAVPTLRLSGLYLALATFAVAVSVPALAKRFDTLTGGSSGVGLAIHSGRWLYEVAWTCYAVLFVLSWLVLRGRLGRALRAVRDSEVAAVSSGVNLAVYKTFAFTISAAWAGVAGGILAMLANYVNPDTYPLLLSLTILIGAVVAGLGSLWGIVVGGLFVEFLPIYAQKSIPLGFTSIGLGKQAPAVVYGIILILIMFLLPMGVAGGLRRLVAPLAFRTRTGR